MYITHDIVDVQRGKVYYRLLHVVYFLTFKTRIFSDYSSFVPTNHIIILFIYRHCTCIVMTYEVYLLLYIYIFNIIYIGKRRRHFLERCSLAELEV